jgi:hypothetical protein
MKKHLVIILLIALVLSSTGCIDVGLGKEMLGGRVEKEKYKTVEKAEMSYAFETTSDPSSTEYSDSRDFSIKKETVWMHIKVEYDQSGWSPVFYPVTRHLTVTVFSSDGKEYKNKTYTDTDEDIIIIENPSSGTWKVEVESEGIGESGHGQDSFTVTVFAKEPI